MSDLKKVIDVAHDLGVGPDMVEEAGRHQVIVDDDVGRR